MGVSFVLTPINSCPITHPVSWSKAAIKNTREPLPFLAPRASFPAIAIARRLVQARTHPDTALSSAAASTAAQIR